MFSCASITKCFHCSPKNAISKAALEKRRRIGAELIDGVLKPFIGNGFVLKECPETGYRIAKFETGPVKYLEPNSLVPSEYQPSEGVKFNLGTLNNRFGLRNFSSTNVVVPFSSEDIMRNPVNYEKSGTIGPPRDQKRVCTCWACTNACVISHAIYRRTGIYRPVSAQWLVDFAYFCDGIHGGYVALQFVRDFGIPFEDSYPYEEVQKVTNEEHDHQRLIRIKNALATIDPMEFGTIRHCFQVNMDQTSVLRALKFSGPLFVGLNEVGKYLDHVGEIIGPSTPKIAETALDGRPAGNHSMMAYAYEYDALSRKAYLGFKNSYGSSDMVKIEINLSKPLFSMWNYVFGAT